MHGCLCQCITESPLIYQAVIYSPTSSARLPVTTSQPLRKFTQFNPAWNPYPGLTPYTSRQYWAVDAAALYLLFLLCLDYLDLVIWQLSIVSIVLLPGEGPEANLN